MGAPDPFAAQSSPRRNPLSYPGAWPSASALVGEESLWELVNNRGETLSWDSERPDRVSACRVRLDPQTAERLGLSQSTAPYLVNVLEESHVVSVDSRIPVLAIGSNASPAQLRHKFETATVPLLIPGVRARVTGAQVGFGSFIAPSGYIPATLFAEEGSVVELVVQWLDAGQLAEIDATESSRYRRVWLDDAAGVDVLLETGERLRGVYAYVAMGGMLGRDGRAWVMGPQNSVRPADVDENRWMPDQSAVMTAVQRTDARASLGSTPAEFLDRYGDLPGYGAQVLADAGLVIEDNPFEHLPDEEGTAPRQYGSLLPAAPRPRGDRLVGIVSRSPDRVSRQAQSVVRLDPDLAQRLGNPGHVEIVSEALADRYGRSAPRALAVVLPASPTDAPAPAPGSGVVQVDHVLRMAAGLAVGEPCILTPARVRRPRWPDVLFGRPNYLTMRVTLADPSSAERDVSLMSGLSLQLLGVTSGDHVVLEGSADEAGEVASVAIKAFETPDVVAAERDRVTGGSWGARFPGARETLGVHPDIPTVFIDSATRDRLGIGAQQLATVRARPARLQQFTNELREVMLVLAIALIGIIGLFTPDPVVGVWVLGAIVVTTFLLMVFRMRRRLAHTLDRTVRRRARRR